MSLSQENEMPTSIAAELLLKPLSHITRFAFSSHIPMGTKSDISEQVINVQKQPMVHCPTSLRLSIINLDISKSKNFVACNHELARVPV